MKQTFLITFSLVLIFSLQKSYAQFKKPPKDPIIVKGGGTPPYNPIPPTILYDITPGPAKKGFSNFITSPDQHKGSNSILEIRSKTTYKEGFSANVNERQYNFYDNGKYPDKKAGDGIYSTTVNEKFNSPVVVNPDPKGNTTNTGRFVIETVTCPPGCKSLIFQTTCTVCFHIKWESSK